MLSEILIRMRYDFDMSQREFSKEIGISQGTISKLERGLGNRRFSTIQQIASFAQCHGYKFNMKDFLEE